MAGAEADPLAVQHSRVVQHVKQCRTRVRYNNGLDLLFDGNPSMHDVLLSVEYLGNGLGVDLHMHAANAMRPSQGGPTAACHDSTTLQQ